MGFSLGENWSNSKRELFPIVRVRKTYRKKLQLSNYSNQYSDMAIKMAWQMTFQCGFFFLTSIHSCSHSKNMDKIDKFSSSSKFLSIKPENWWDCFQITTEYQQRKYMRITYHNYHKYIGSIRYSVHSTFQYILFSNSSMTDKWKKGIKTL